MLKKIKSLFVTEVEVPAEDTPSAEGSKEENKETSEMSKEKESKEDVGQTHSGNPNPDFIGILINALQDSRKEDFDYLHFKQNLKSLNHMDFDESTRFKTAFAIAQNQGVDKDSLVRSANFFIEVLHEEEKKFSQSLDNQRKDRIDARKEQIKKLRDKIFKKQSEIEKLNEEIRQLEGKIDKEKEGLMENRERIEQTSSDFSTSLKFLKKKISDDIDSLKDYLD